LSGSARKGEKGEESRMPLYLKREKRGGNIDMAFLETLTKERREKDRTGAGAEQAEDV